MAKMNPNVEAVLKIIKEGGRCDHVKCSECPFLLTTSACGGNTKIPRHRASQNRLYKASAWLANNVQQIRDEGLAEVKAPKNEVPKKEISINYDGVLYTETHINEQRVEDCEQQVQDLRKKANVLASTLRRHKKYQKEYWS